MEDAPTVDWMARHLAAIQQQYTQQAGVRPFGIATLMAGVPSNHNNNNNDADSDATPARPVLYQTDPAGTQSKWKAQVIGGRNAKSLREFLEKQYTADLDEAATLKLAVAALLEVVDSGAKTMEVCVVRAGGRKEMLPEAAIEAVVAQLTAETTTTPAAVSATTAAE